MDTGLLMASCYCVSPFLRDVPIPIKKQVLDLIEGLADTNDLSEYCGLIVHPLTRLLDNYPELHAATMDAFAALLSQLDKKFTVFIPLIHSAMARNRVSHRKYDFLVAQLRNGKIRLRETSWKEFFWISNFDFSRKIFPIDFSNLEMVMWPFFMNATGKCSHLRVFFVLGHSTLPDEANSRSRRYYQGNRIARPTGEPVDSAPLKSLDVGIASLRRAWSTARCASKDDWLEWLRRLSLELLKESPSPALRACSTLAQSHPVVAKYVNQSNRSFDFFSTLSPLINKFE